MPKKTSEIPIEENSLFLFIGAADSGKSYAATSFGFKTQEFGGTDPRPMYVLELDGRVRALSGRPVIYDSFTNEDGAIAVLNKLRDLSNSCKLYKKSPYHTICLDSFTSFCDFAVADSIAVTDEERKQGKSVGRIRADITMLTMQDYGLEAEAVRKLLWEFLTDLKRYCNVIVVAHEVEKYRVVKGAPGEPTKTEFDGFKLLARNKIAARFPTKFDEIYHFLPKELIVSTKSIRRQVRFQDEVARTSYPQLNKVEAHDISGKEFYNWWKEKISS